MPPVKTFGERIADALVEDGLLSPQQVTELLEQQKKEGTRLLKLLTDKSYINETDLGKVKIGSTARVTTDSYPGKSYNGRVTFIASQAEFTPKQIQTQQERVKLVYRIKIDVENPGRELKSNMPVDAEILLGQ